jgi:hypothetical protein
LSHDELKLIFYENHSYFEKEKHNYAVFVDEIDRFFCHSVLNFKQVMEDEKMNFDVETEKFYIVF